MVTVRSGNIDFFGSVKRMITGQDALMWLAVTAAVGAVCLVLCRAGASLTGKTETTEENRECGQPQRWSAALSFP